MGAEVNGKTLTVEGKEYNCCAEEKEEQAF